MSEFSRRELLSAVAAGMLAGTVPMEAQHVHALLADDKASTGAHVPKALNAHEYATLNKLADYIIPADEHSPGAVEAGAPGFIDSLASQNNKLLAIYTGGIAWLDHYTEAKYGSSFLDAQPTQQKQALDLIAFRANESPELGPGIVFFDWARRMVVDAFYTSPVGVKDLGYMGNTAVAKFVVPQNAIDYALKRSPV